jgi:hypothetical protein
MAQPRSTRTLLDTGSDPIRGFTFANSAVALAAAATVTVVA